MPYNQNLQDTLTIFSSNVDSSLMQFMKILYIPEERKTEPIKHWLAVINAL